VLGAALIAVGLAVLHHDIITIAVGAFVLIMGLAHGVMAVTGRTQKGQAR
jgi:uncharacterized membrane protein HdeD (DUF308 family)